MHKLIKNRVNVSRRFGAVLWLLVGVCGSAAAQDRPYNWVSKRNVTERTPSYVAVVGAVAKPGVYEFPTASPDIMDLIRQAGGVDKEASGSLGVVRNGRVAQQTFYSPRLELALYSGDIVVAGYRSGAPQESHVDLAFAGLIDRPVVAAMRPEHATLRKVVRFLNQPPDETIATVEVLQPGYPPERGASFAQTQKQTLRSGTVLVFDPAVIRTESIPPLPGTYRVGQHAVRSDIGQPQVWAHAPADRPASAHAGINVSAADVESVSSSTTADGAVRGPMLPRPHRTRRLTRVPPPQAAPAGQPDRSDQRPVQGQRSRARESADPGHPSGPVTQEAGPIASEGVRESSDEETRETDKDERPETTDEEGSETSALAGIRGLVIGGIGTLVVVGALILLIASRRRSHQPLTVAAAQPEGRRSLDALIHNSLPVVEQRLRFPQRLQVYGRPVGKQTIRIDAAHQLPPLNNRPTDSQATPLETIVDPSSPSVSAERSRRDAEHDVSGGSQAVRRPHALGQQTGQRMGQTVRFFSTVQGVMER